VHTIPPAAPRAPQQDEVERLSAVARLHEYQGKALLKGAGIAVPRGSAASSPGEAARITADLAGPVVIKIQAWTTGRKALGGVAFANTPDEAATAAQRLLVMKVGAFPVEQVLVEEQLPIEHEVFVSMSIDDAARRPVLLLGVTGGSGIEDRAAQVARISVNVDGTLDRAAVQTRLAASHLPADQQPSVADAITKIATLARRIEARSLEVNPLVTTRDGRVMAADCRMTIDDYAVFRHPDLGIDIARELDHPPTRLERIAYAIEQDDHRGTFYFAQLPPDPDKPLIGFHGAGGGGSMMSMDAITAAGFSIANFTDTSGNPSVAKVYRAARIILAQPGIVGYFGSGSGVASQEQFHSAYGLAKAFIEMNLAIPAVIRLGGNSEDRAVEILEDACRNLPALVRGFKKDDTPAVCAAVFSELVARCGDAPATMQRRVPAFVGRSASYSFPITGGRAWIDHAACDAETTQLVNQHSAGLLREQDGKPVLAISQAEVATKDSDLIACEIECRRAGVPVVFVDLPIPGLDTKE